MSYPEKNQQNGINFTSNKTTKTRTVPTLKNKVNKDKQGTGR
jgi:hypothetical protein